MSRIVSRLCHGVNFALLGRMRWWCCELDVELEVQTVPSHRSQSSQMQSGISLECQRVLSYFHGDATFGSESLSRSEESGWIDAVSCVRAYWHCQPNCRENLESDFVDQSNRGLGNSLRLIVDAATEEQSSVKKSFSIGREGRSNDHPGIETSCWRARSKLRRERVIVKTIFGY